MDVVRKRVTKVGSGAWSIYLPKKWIDAWTPEQQESREVELRRISQSILISPVHQARRMEATAPDHRDAVIALLLSGYIRGDHHVLLTPETEFGNDTIAAARDFLRHLDERIVADSRPGVISFTLRADLPPPAHADDVLTVLGAKVAEVLRLAQDAIRTNGHDPDRTLHALRLLRDTKSEDVDRLFYQAARLVATLEIPLESVSRYQLLGLAAADLQRMADQALRMADTVLTDMDLTRTDLDYPRDHLLQRLRPPPPPTGIARALVGACSKGFDDVAALLDRILPALAGRDVAACAAIEHDADQAREALQQRVLDNVAEHWGTNTDAQAAMAAFTASKHATALQNILDHQASICRHAIGLMAAT